MPGPRPFRHLVGDALVAVLLLAVDVGAAGNLLRDRPPWQLPASVLVAAALAAALVLRRRWPVGVLAVVLGISLPAALLGVLWDPFAATAFALYPVALGGPERLALRATAAGAGAVVIAAGVGELLRPGGAWWYGFGLALVAGAWLWGGALRERRAQALRLERQRAHQVLVDERLRIARELHDVVTHGMGLIAVKAGVANHLSRDRPEEASAALRVIEATSREALTEMRRLLGVLRDDNAVLTPAPALADLPRLVERAATAGVEVELSLGDTGGLPEPMAATAYRIVHEAVTNVIKHAAPARCRVDVRLTGGALGIEVTDDGRRPPAPGRPGHGLIGMRERVAMYDGDFDAGPAPGGGYRVTATLRARDE